MAVVGEIQSPAGPEWRSRAVLLHPDVGRSLSAELLVDGAGVAVLGQLVAYGAAHAAACAWDVRPHRERGTGRDADVEAAADPGGGLLHDAARACCCSRPRCRAVSEAMARR